MSAAIMVTTAGGPGLLSLSARDLPVLLCGGRVYGPADWPHPIHVAADADPRIVTAAVRAGFDVRQEDERRSR